MSTATGEKTMEWGKSNYARWQQGGQSGCDRKELEAAEAGTVSLNICA